MRPRRAGRRSVVSENYYPGWEATVDGQPAKAERANLSLMAVALPEGARRWNSVRLGAVPHRQAITLAAIALALLAAGGGLFVGRRRPDA
jgi:uncharacterized membrane protein YfhO